MRQQESNGSLLVLLLLAAILLATGEIQCPAPGPAPDPPPDSSLVQRVRQIVSRQVSGATRSAEARQIAQVYREIAADVEALRDPLHLSPIKRPRDAVGLANHRIDQLLSDRASAWQAARQDIARELSARQVGRGIYDVAEVFVQLADALEEVR
jgi:hypothetical protein